MSIMVAMTPERVIGRDGQLPWRLSNDLRRFKQRTMGHHIILGRKTYESIGRLLPGRRTVIVSRQHGLEVPGARVAHSLPEAVDGCAGDSEIFFVGGEQIYREALETADRLYLTRVHGHVKGDAHFPELDTDQWELIDQEYHGADAKNEYPHTFEIWERPESRRR